MPVGALVLGLTGILNTADGVLPLTLTAPSCTPVRSSVAVCVPLACRFVPEIDNHAGCAVRNTMLVAPETDSGYVSGTDATKTGAGVASQVGADPSAAPTIVETALAPEAAAKAPGAPPTAGSERCSRRRGNDTRSTASIL